MFGSFNTNFVPFIGNESSDEDEQMPDAPKKMEEDPIDFLDMLPNPLDTYIEINGDKRRFTHVPPNIPTVPAKVMGILANDIDITREHQEIVSRHMCIPIWLQTSPLIMFMTGDKHWSSHGRGFLQTMCNLYQFRDAVIKGKAVTLHKSVDLDYLIKSYYHSLQLLSDTQDERLDDLYLNPSVGNASAFHALCSQYAMDLVHLEERFLFELLIAPYENAPPLATLLSTFPTSLYPKTEAEHKSHCEQSFLFFRLKVERVQMANPAYPKTIRFPLIEQRLEWLPNEVMEDYFHFANEEGP